MFGVLIMLLPACWGDNGACTSCGDHDNHNSKEIIEVKKGLIVVNVLDKEHYDDCHIKGSINIPFEEADKFVDGLDAKYGAQKGGVEIVVYCSNYMCSASSEVVKKLLSKGFTNAKAYEAGTAEWFNTGLPVEGVCQKVYLKRKMSAPSHNDNQGFVVITTQELAQKMGLELPQPKQELATNVVNIEPNQEKSGHATTQDELAK